MDRFQTSVFWIWPACCLALVLLSGCSGEREKMPPEAQSAVSEAKGVRVTTQPITLRSVERIVGVVGTLHGYEEMSLGAKVAGRVRKITHDVSDRVRPGELLLEIEPTDFELNVRQAKRALQVELAKLGLAEIPSSKTDVTQIPTVVQARLRRDNAERRYDRAKSLEKSRASTEEDRTEKLSEFHVATAEYDNQLLLAKAGIASIHVKQESLMMAQQQLQDTLIRVPAPSLPIPGRGKEVTYAITSRPVAEGSYVAVGAELFKLVIEQPLKFRTHVPERKSSVVRLGQKCELYVASHDQPFPGEVTRINPQVDRETRTFEVEILVPNVQGALKPGAFAKTKIITSIDAKAATVPLECLVNFAGVTKIFLVENGKAREVPVTVGVETTEWVEIASPALPEDAQVVTSGQTAISDGTEVVVRANTDQNAAVVRKQPESSEDAPAEPVARRERAK